MLLNKIKADQLAARKTKNAVTANVLTTLIGEAESVGKDFNRVSTDNEVITVIQKFVKNIEITISFLEKAQIKSDSDFTNIVIKRDEALKEKEILSAYLPKQLSEDELKQNINSIKEEISASPKDMGKILTLLKVRFSGQYDGKMASDLTRAILAI